ncbi:hypothetical protein QTJ16_003571 [Diplocarpon rosae]|uniref:Glycosyltransferase family 8 protein n=1 Tax=Diplocarpon rosae TaxID=946125 RepID=A0AAD9T3H5_9HELO|nr:hypothetical protein QTJ16_003571 [Diplocarpon rosae]
MEAIRARFWVAYVVRRRRRRRGGGGGGGETASWGERGRINARVDFLLFWVRRSVATFSWRELGLDAISLEDKKKKKRKEDVLDIPFPSGPPRHHSRNNSTAPRRTFEDPSSQMEPQHPRPPPPHPRPPPQPPSPQPPPSTRAWVTLLTGESYIPGAILLAHSLQKQHSRYPLIILYTPSLPAALLPALRREASLSQSILRPTAPLTPPQQRPLIAARFEDTWTKLRIFELCEYERLVFLDADMLVRGNMDELFDLPLPGRDWIVANHCCVCNLDGDAWAPADWVPENCAYTGLTHPSCLAAPAPVPPAGAGPPTHALLNSGLFVCTPHAALWDEVRRFLATDPRVEHFLFPDQDLLAAFFRGRWRPLGYQYNALKTMRYWHPAMWRDAEVRNLHYIVDKPWRARVGADGVAGYLGKDGETHRWWWRAYEGWERERERMGERGCSRW